MNLTYADKITQSEGRLVTFLSNVTKSICSLEAFSLVTLLSYKVATAADSGNLMDVFNTESTRGSLKWLDKFNWIGGFLNFIISAFCFLALFFMVFQKLLTITYFVLQDFWDNAHEVKKSHMNSSFLGLKGYGEDAFNAKGGSGLDAIFHLLYIFVPDVRQMSEKREGGKYDSDDITLVTWFIKTAPSTIFGLLLLSMGFSGSLMRTYAMVVNGLSVVTDEVASANSEQFVNNLLHSGSSYSYSLQGTGKPADLLRQDIAESIDRKCLAKVNADQRTDQLRMNMGKNIENIVRANFTDSNIQSWLTSNAGSSASDLTEADYGYIKCDLYVSGEINPDAMYSFPVSDVTGGTSNEYVNAFLVLEKRAPSYNYVDLGN